MPEERVGAAPLDHPSVTDLAHRIVAFDKRQMRRGEQGVERRLDEAEKHALVYLIPRFLDPTSGEILIDRKNLRPAYVDAVVDELLNWDFAAENLARETTWTYPA